MTVWTVSGVNKEYIVAELVVEQNTISSAGEKNGGGGHPSGSMTALCNRINKRLSEELQIHHRTSRNVLPH
jgi:nanoRNase/pAp phosphatase (c-di-AMP/oligoRNAs hydrolase)